jgi:hypothetical protein
MLLALPELPGEIIRSAVERLLDSRLPGELQLRRGRSAARNRRHSALYGAIRPGSEQEAGS